MKLPIETKRLFIVELNPNMAESLHKNSLDDDNRKFMPDEVFETLEAAQDVIETLISFYEEENMPLVYAITLKDGTQVGHVEAVPIQNGWEVGYHIGIKYTNNGYASEALQAFIPAIMEKLHLKQIYGICRLDNIASWKILEKCKFELEYDGFGSYHGEEHHVVRYKKELD